MALLRYIYKRPTINLIFSLYLSGSYTMKHAAKMYTRLLYYQANNNNLLTYLYNVSQVLAVQHSSKCTTMNLLLRLNIISCLAVTHFY